MFDTWCGWILFLHKKLFIGIFHISNMASEIAANGHVTIFIIIGSNERFIYMQHSVKVSQQ